MSQQSLQSFPSQADLARTLGLDQSVISRHISIGLIPEPEIKQGRRYFYSQEKFNEIVLFLKNRKENQFAKKLLAALPTSR